MSETKTELELLKERADVMGVTYHPNIGIEALKKKIEEKLTDGANEEKPPEESVGETAAQRRMRLNKEARVLKRVRITCMNPAKKAWTSEIFSVSNSMVGTITRVVPFNAEEGWHVEAMLLKMIKKRKFQTFFDERLPGGRKVRRGKLVPEFAVEELKPLTVTELENLTKRQAMAGSIEE